MKPKYCCNFVDRSDSPVLPSPRTVHGPTTPLSRAKDDSNLTDSRYTSVRTEDLRDIQRIFEHAQSNDEEDPATPKETHGSKNNSPRKSIIGSLFRKTINRPRSKSLGNLLNDPNQFQQTKHDIRKTLFSQQRPESGGYDTDAAVMGDVDASVSSQQHDDGSPTRGRSKLRPQDVGSGDMPQRKLRLSTSLSLPRISLDLDGRAVRRSFSVCSNNSIPDRMGRQKLRLPQLSAGSRHWKHSVMESLHISSPSMSILPGPDHEEDVSHEDLRPGSKGRGKQPDESLMEGVPRLSLMKGSLDRPFAGTYIQSIASPSAPKLQRTTNSFVNLMKASFDRPLSNSDPITHTKKLSTEKSSSGLVVPFTQRRKFSTDVNDRSFASNCMKHSRGGSKLGLVGNLEKNEIGKHRASTASVHLQNMRISHHLRSESSFSTAAITTAAPTAATTRNHTPIERVGSRHGSGTAPLPIQLARRPTQMSKSGLASNEVLKSGNNAATILNASVSSMYSDSVASPVHSPAGSFSNIPRPSFVVTSTQIQHDQGSVRAALENTDPLLPVAIPVASPNEQSILLKHNSRSNSSDSITIMPTPANLSSSNLSKGSKSSKTSRFKEDFDTPDLKKSTKRSSIANLFTRSKIRKGANDIVVSLDGSVDEPRRLQRAVPLDQRNAAGLFSKAIKAQQEEKSCMYLSGNKERAQHDIYRQRSTSFSRGASVSKGKQPAGAVSLPPSSPAPKNRSRTSGESFLRPTFNLPGFANNSTPEIFSKKTSPLHTRKGLRPEFSLPIFSHSEEDDDSPDPPTRTRSSVPLDPKETRALAIMYEDLDSQKEASDDTTIHSDKPSTVRDGADKPWSDIDAMLPLHPATHEVTVRQYVTAFRHANHWSADVLQTALESLADTLRTELNSQVRPAAHVRYDQDFSIEQLLYAFVAVRNDRGLPLFPDEMFRPNPGGSLSPTPDIPKVPSFDLNDRPVMMDSPPLQPTVHWVSGPPTPSSLGESAVDVVDDAETNLGSWSRYPSHTRAKRTGSAGAADDVKTHDFAYHIDPNHITADSSSSAEGDLDPKSKGSKKKDKKKKARTGLPKSRSMMIGKDFIKNYARLIRSPSVEWLSHGKGHRSSISPGGNLAHPELEVLPPVFAAMPDPVPESQEEDAALADVLVHKDTIDMIEMKKLRSHNRVADASHLDGASKTMMSGGLKPSASEHGMPAASPSDVLPVKLIPWDTSPSEPHQNGSCAELPRKSSTGAQTSSEQTNNTSISGDPGLLIDAMLRNKSSSGSGSGSHSGVTSPGSSDSLPGQDKDKSGHGKMASVTSIRASSMDLLKKLAEAEEREKLRCLELLMCDRKAAEEGEFLRRGSVREGASAEVEVGIVHARSKGSLRGEYDRVDGGPVQEYINGEAGVMDRSGGTGLTVPLSGSAVMAN
ncbi:hypothetical protein EJ08DRAFT_696059 [Tothia fuscella]|uniref:Uncharacterized protein n=1 Tax=Tothia fuscella TaxID=1048955 RepID=A0A9P4NUM3_9PEZI|nr:hypothetical protein EJ08DRAFT_696059 [Tothia fuscella]